MNVTGLTLMASLIGLTACGPTVEPGRDEMSSAGKGGSGGSSVAGNSAAGHSAASAGSGGTGPSWPQSPDGFAGNPPTSDELMCPSHEPLESQTFATVAEKQQALIGTWTQCSQQGIGPDDAAGLDITPDGRYFVLVRNAEGELVRQPGVLHEGRVELDGNWVVFVNPGASEQTVLHFSNEGVYRMYAFNTDFIGYDYIR